MNIKQGLKFWDKFLPEVKAVLVKAKNAKYKDGALTRPGSTPYYFNNELISKILSPKGGKVKNKFYTSQGSEYILTEDGFARRIKSPQGKLDEGLHDWNKGYTVFLNPKELNGDKTAIVLRDIELIRHKFPLAIPTMSKKGLVWMVPENNNWRILTNLDLFPTAVKLNLLDGNMSYIIEGTKEPTLGYLVFEYNRDPVNFWYHPGHEVDYIELLPLFKNGSKLIPRNINGSLIKSIASRTGKTIKELSSKEILSFLSKKKDLTLIKK